jgi:hypothetical protein
MREYLIQDNGGRQFQVNITLETIDVSVQQEDRTYKFWKEFPYEKVFVEFPKEPQQEGNSILVKLGRFKYLHIGEVIYTVRFKILGPWIFSVN